MSDATDKTLRDALRRGFPQLSVRESAELLADLRSGNVHFGEGVLRLRKGAVDDKAVAEWLAGTGKWQERLLETIIDENRTLRWAAEYTFLYVVAA